MCDNGDFEPIHRSSLANPINMNAAESPLTTAANLSDDTIRSYREEGFVHIPGILSREEAEGFRSAALHLSEERKSTADRSVFQQMVNVWQGDEVMKKLTLHRNVAEVAEKLAGCSLRLWHDQILIKHPRNSTPTEFHQDQPYWPHANSTRPISAWIALCDVPVERGCMTFIPGSHQRSDLPRQMLDDSRSLFSICPDLEWERRVTVPLKAGDCTFHHGRCAHMATPNFTDDPRVAHVVIFVEEETTYRKAPHVVTDPLGLDDGAPLDGPLFPRVSDFPGQD